jgi:hypothetical protein
VAKHGGRRIQKVAFISDPCVEGKHDRHVQALSLACIWGKTPPLPFQPFLEIDPRMRDEIGAHHQIVA